ncbi:hypothetical protein C8F01DRAFT_1365774 [Mycena amicta]|nr:hypothetical protein C8F01DRAFT_1365774 [Mycena amicta]
MPIVLARRITSLDYLSGWQVLRLNNVSGGMSSSFKLEASLQRRKTLAGQKLRSLTVEKGLATTTTLISSSKTSATLRKDLLALFWTGNEGVINLLLHYFEMSHVDARPSRSTATFPQTELVVESLGVARKLLNVPAPKLFPSLVCSKNTSTTLRSSRIVSKTRRTVSEQHQNPTRRSRLHSHPMLSVSKYQWKATPDGRQGIGQQGAGTATTTDDGWGESVPREYANNGPAAFGSLPPASSPTNANANAGDEYGERDENFAFQSPGTTSSTWIGRGWFVAVFLESFRHGWIIRAAQQAVALAVIILFLLDSSILSSTDCQWFWAHGVQARIVVWRDRVTIVAADTWESRHSASGLGRADYGVLWL